MFELRPEQKKICDWALDNYQSKPIALAAPTAFGKSIVAKTLADSFIGRTAIITYTNQLVGQFIRSFPMPALIGASNYLTEAERSEAIHSANHAKTVLFNPASYLLHMKKEGSRPFDNVIIDEADACLGLFKILNPTTIDWPVNETPCVETIVEQLKIQNYDSFAELLARHQNNYWWEVCPFYNKKTKTMESSLKIHNVVLKKSFAEKFFPKNIILMSGTLFPTFCNELLGTSDYLYYEAPSPIPIERRPIEGLTQEEGWVFPTDYDEMLELLDIVLERYKERPAIVHTTYDDTKNMMRIREHLNGYQSKEEKAIALEAIEMTDKYLLTPGLVEGVDLAEDKARLNVILRASFPNLGADAIRKRRSLPDGYIWYTDYALRSAIQAAGRTTRTPTDYSKTVIADCRLTRLIKQHIDRCPSYFVEALKF